MRLRWKLPMTSHAVVLLLEVDEVVEQLEDVPLGVVEEKIVVEVVLDVHVDEEGVVITLDVVIEIAPLEVDYEVQVEEEHVADELVPLVLVQGHLAGGELDHEGVVDEALARRAGEQH